MRLFVQLISGNPWMFANLELKLMHFPKMGARKSRLEWYFLMNTPERTLVQNLAWMRTVSTCGLS